MKTILNLTQHSVSTEQVLAGVIEPTESDKSLIINLLTFEKLPSQHEIEVRAQALASIALAYQGSNEVDYEHASPLHVMIGGAPFFMAPLEKALRDTPFKRELIPVYAFSKRESIDEPQADGSIRKTSVFKHAGFIGGNL